MSKELFEAVVGTPPPSTVDIAAIIRRRRRVRAARRLGLVMAPVAVSGVVTAAVLVAGGGGTGAPVHTGQPPLATSSAPAPELTAERLRAALAEAVAAVVPDARWLPDGQPPVLEPPPPARTHPSAIVACDAFGCTVAAPSAPPTTDVSFSGSADLERGGSTVLAMVGIHTSRSLLDCDDASFANSSCTVGSSPHGYAMATRAYRPSALPDGMTGPIPVVTRKVAIELPDGGVLQLAVNGPKDPTVPLDMVLTETELVAIADEVVHRLTG
jgi:hypothetical protein